MGIDGDYIGKMFDTNRSFTAAIYIQWRLPSLGSRVAITLSAF